MGIGCSTNSACSIVGGWHSVTTQANAELSIVLGSQNTVTGDSYVFGKENGKTTSLGSGCFVLGQGNNSYSSTNRAGGVMIGYSNRIIGNKKTMIFGHNNSPSYGNVSGPGVLVGNYLRPVGDQTSSTVVLGEHNSTAHKLATPIVVIGAGRLAEKNAIEIDDSQCKIRHDLQLESDTTAVNAIDAPADPSNPTTEEKTLATLGSLQALKDVINNAHLQQREQLLTGQTTLLTTGTAYDLESTFSITIPSWANRLRLGYQIQSNGSTQNYIEFSTVGGTFSTFSIREATGTLYGVNLTYANKTLTINKVLSIDPANDDWKVDTAYVGLISITAFGDFSI